jgi:hypothetical protein
MAAFKQHITFSSVLGFGYTTVLISTGLEWVHAVLAGALCGIAGMLPDLDSASGRPIRELFGITAAAVPLLLMERLRNSGLDPEEALLFAGGLYLIIRFGAAWLLKHLTVHRGMFHSLPAALIAGEISYLVHDCPVSQGRLVLAGGVVLGFASHLVLDEIYAVDASGLRLRLNKAAGSALKLASRSVPATVITWMVLTALTYLIGIDQGYFQEIDFQFHYAPTSQRAQR